MKVESENRRLELLPKMYGNPARRREELERLELEQCTMLSFLKFRFLLNY